MSESRGLETVFGALLCVSLGAGGMWLYRDKMDSQAQVVAQSESISTITSAAELLRTQLPNITRTVDKLGALNVEYRKNADAIKSLVNCAVPDELARLSHESMAQINANADGANPEAKARVQGK